jgi:hypothetical protein
MRPPSLALGMMLEEGLERRAAEALAGSMKVMR